MLDQFSSSEGPFKILSIKRPSPFSLTYIYCLPPEFRFLFLHYCIMDNLQVYLTFFYSDLLL